VCELPIAEHVDLVAPGRVNLGLDVTTCEEVAALTRETTPPERLARVRARLTAAGLKPPRTPGAVASEWSDGTDADGVLVPERLVTNGDLWRLARAEAAAGIYLPQQTALRCGQPFEASGEIRCQLPAGHAGRHYAGVRVGSYAWNDGD